MRHLFTTLAASLALASPALAEEVQPTMAEATTVQPGDHLIGSADAAHSLVVYASVTCGHCGDWFSEEWPRVKAELVDTGKLRVAFREIPTTPAQVSMAGFLLANCAPEGRFFDSVVSQMERQDEMREMISDGLGQDYFLSVGQEVGIETEEDVKACFVDDANFDPIDRSMERFEATESTGVPAFFVDGEKVEGKHDADALVGMLE